MSLYFHCILYAWCWLSPRYNNDTDQNVSDQGNMTKWGGVAQWRSVEHRADGVRLECPASIRKYAVYESGGCGTKCTTLVFDLALDQAGEEMRRCGR